MRLYSVFNRLSDFPGSPYFVLKGEYDREGSLYRYNQGMEKVLLKAGMLENPNLTALFPTTFSSEFPERMMDQLKNEAVTIRSLVIDRKRTSFLCFEKINTARDRITLIALPFDKTNVLQLLRMYSQFEGYYNSNPDIVIAVDGRWHIVDINHAGMVKLGYESKQEFFSKNRGDVFVLSEDAYDYILSEVGKGNSITEFEVILKKKADGFITGFASIFSVHYESPEDQLLYFHLKDVTLQTDALLGQIQQNLELTELNEELNRAHATMVSQEKMAALGLLAAGLAHEINNPLGFVFNNITVLMNHFRDLRSFVASVRGLYGNSKPGSGIDEVKSLDDRLELSYIFDDIGAIEKENEEGVERIKKIINSLRDFARDDSVQDKTYYDLNKSVQDTLLISKNEYKYKANIEESYGEVNQILCNALEINQVLLSLLMNSIESIKRQKRRNMGSIRIETHQDENNVHFTITDDGEGVPEKIRLKIFDPFFTTKPVGGGTGLGLAVAQDIVVNRHGGSLQLLPHEGQGARFQMSLPRPVTTEDER